MIIIFNNSDFKVMKKILLITIFIICIISCEEIIEVNDISQDQVIVLAPTDSSIITNNNIRFSWQELDFATTYRLQIAHPNFMSAIQIEEDTLLNSSSFEKTLETGNYEWRVKALNSAYETEYQTQSFSIEE